MITFELEFGQIITLNNDNTFRIVNSKPRNDETMFDKRGIFYKEEDKDGIKIIFDIKEQFENGNYKPYLKSLQIEFFIFYSLDRVKLLKWKYKDNLNPYEGLEFPIKIIKQEPGFLYKN